MFTQNNSQNLSCNEDTFMQDNNSSNKETHKKSSLLISNNNLLNKEEEQNQELNQNPNAFSPFPKPDFTVIEEKESNFQYKEPGSYKKSKSIVPESPMKSPSQKFFTPVKLHSNLFGNSSTFRKLNFNEVEDAIKEEELYNRNDGQIIKDKDLNLQDNLEGNNNFKLKGNTKNYGMHDKFDNCRKSSVNDNNLNMINNEERKRGINKYFSKTNKNDNKVNFLDFMKGKRTQNNNTSIIKPPDFKLKNDIKDNNFNMFNNNLINNPPLFLNNNENNNINFTNPNNDIKFFNNNKTNEDKTNSNTFNNIFSNNIINLPINNNILIPRENNADVEMQKTEQSQSKKFLFK